MQNVTYGNRSKFSRSHNKLNYEPRTLGYGPVGSYPIERGRQGKALVCSECGSEFTVQYGRNRKVCLECEERIRQSKRCEFCGGPMHTNGYGINDLIKRRFCSRSCAQRAKGKAVS